MIEVEIPNNVSEYKPKFLLGLSGKQVVCVVLTAAVIFLDFKFLKPFIGDTLALGFAAVPALIAACFGWIEPYGMTFDKYLRSVLLQALIAPKTRKVKYNSSIVVPCDKDYVPIPDSELNNEVLECVNYVREKIGIEVEKADVSKKRKQKYKKSKLAMM